LGGNSGQERSEASLFVKKEKGERGHSRGRKRPKIVAEES